MSGLHKSPFKGFSVEFAEHRHYGPGDEIRHIDWRAFGKTDRYYVKEYEEETNLKAYLVVDTSGSMGYAGRTRMGRVSKFEYARQLAAALAYLMISQRDAVGLITFDTAIRSMIPALSAPCHFSVLCKSLSDAQVGGETPLSGILHGLAERIRRRGLVIVLSDGFDKLDELTNALQHLRHRRHEVLFFHVLAPEEEEFPFRRPSSVPEPGTAGPPPARRPGRDAGGVPGKVQRVLHAVERTHRGDGGGLPQGVDGGAARQTILDYLAARTHRGRSAPSKAQGGGR